MNFNLNSKLNNFYIMELNEDQQKYQNKSKKISRLTNSYQMQFKNRKNKNTDNKLNRQKNKSNYNTIYSQSNYSAKTFNQKPKNNLCKNNKALNAQILNNFSKNEDNFFTLSNYANSDMNIIKENKDISANRLIKNNKEKDLKLNEEKMDIKELSDSQNTKIKKNFINNKDENIFNINQKNNEECENLNNSDKYLQEINKKNSKVSNNTKENLKKQKSSKIFKKMNITKKFKNINGINHNLNKKKFKEEKKTINIQEEEKNNYSQGYEIMDNYNKFNKIDINLRKPFINKIQIQEKNIIKTEVNDKLLYNNEIDEKFNNLYMKIQGKKENSKNFETISNIEDNKLYQITYPNLKRYRQKSDSNLRVNKEKSNLKKEENITNKFNKIKYPKNINENNNLSKFKTLEATIQNENSSKRMINILLNKEKDPELKEILSNLQITMNNFPKNEEKKENNYLSTLPANNLSPFETFNFDNGKYNKRLNLKYKINNYNLKYNIRETYNFKKFEKFNSTFNDFKNIINGKITNKKRNGQKYINQTGIIYSNLYPVNNLENDVFILEN